MPTIYNGFKSTDIPLNNYPLIYDSSTPKLHSLTRYTENYSHAIVIFFHPNSSSISHLTEYKVTNLSDDIYLMKNGFDMFFREDRSLISLTHYNEGNKEGVELYFENNGVSLSSKKEFHNNLEVYSKQYKYLDSCLYSTTKYINKIKVACTIYRPNKESTAPANTSYPNNQSTPFCTQYYQRDNDSVLSHEVYLQVNGLPLLLIQYLSDGITKSYEFNYREDGTISSEIHYQTDGITPSYIMNYQLDGVTPFSIEYYQPNGLPSQEIFYDINGAPYVQRVYYSDGTTKNFPIQTNPLQLTLKQKTE